MIGPLGRIIRVDVDVFNRQVGGPEDAGPLPLVQLDGNGKLGLGDVSVGRCLIKLRGAAAVAAHGQVAERDVDAVGIDLRA